MPVAVDYLATPLYTRERKVQRIALLRYCSASQHVLSYVLGFQNIHCMVTVVDGSMQWASLYSVLPHSYVALVPIRENFNLQHKVLGHTNLYINTLSILYPDTVSVCASVRLSVTEVMSLPIWGPISACIVSATVTLPHFRVQ